jgi:predicted enzyme related to lactoylglutathione lyase
MPAHLDAKIVFYDVPSTNLDASNEFYSALLGTPKFPRAPEKGSPVYFHPLSPEGTDITLHEKRDQDPPDIPVTYFAVRDLKNAVAKLEGLGGKVVTKQRLPLPSGKALQQYRAAAKAAGHKVGDRLGEAVIMLDPDENPLGLVQLHDHAAYYFRAGPFQSPLRADQAEGVALALKG